MQGEGLLRTKVERECALCCESRKESDLGNLCQVSGHEVCTACLTQYEKIWPQRSGCVYCNPSPVAIVDISPVIPLEGATSIHPNVEETDEVQSCLAKSWQALLCLLCLASGIVIFSWLWICYLSIAGGIATGQLVEPDWTVIGVYTALGGIFITLTFIAWCFCLREWRTHRDTESFLLCFILLALLLLITLAIG